MELYKRCLEKTMELVSEQGTHFTMSELPLPWVSAKKPCIKCLKVRKSFF